MDFLALSLSLHRARKAAGGPHPLWGPAAEAQAHVSPSSYPGSTGCHPWGLFFFYSILPAPHPRFLYRVSPRKPELH